MLAASDPVHINQLDGTNNGSEEMWEHHGKI
jgi:hypothetical protein